MRAVAPRAGHLLFQVIEAFYEKGSQIVMMHLTSGKSGGTFAQDATRTAELLDTLRHDAYLAHRGRKLSAEASAAGKNYAE